MIPNGILGREAVTLQGQYAGCHTTFTGLVHFDGAHTTPCHVKLLETKALANEILAGVLAHSAGLPSPAGFLVRVYHEDYPEATPYRYFAEDYSLAYGSASLPFQTMHDWSLGRGLPLPQVLMTTWRNWVEVMVFDEWIANSGRDPHDALVDPNGLIWVIDHEKAFCGSDWDMRDLNEATYTSNQILESLGKAAALPTQESIRRRIDEFVHELRKIDVRASVYECGVTAFLQAIEVATIIDFLEVRRRNLATNLMKRLGY